MEKALIAGITGQDGAYLAEPLAKGYEVHGLKRRGSLLVPIASIICAMEDLYLIPQNKMELRSLISVDFGWALKISLQALLKEAIKEYQKKLLQQFNLII